MHSARCILEQCCQLCNGNSKMEKLLRKKLVRYIEFVKFEVLLILKMTIIQDSEEVETLTLEEFEKGISFSN